MGRGLMKKAGRSVAYRKRANEKAEAWPSEGDGGAWPPVAYR